MEKPSGAELLLAVTLVLGAAGALIGMAWRVGLFDDPTNTASHQELMTLYSNLAVGSTVVELERLLDGVTPLLRVSRMPEQRRVRVSTTEMTTLARNRVLWIDLGENGLVERVRVRTADSPSSRFDTDPPDKIRAPDDSGGEERR